jgi:hypothetical protein
VTWQRLTTLNSIFCGRADAGNYYVNRHRDLYLQMKKKFRGDVNGNILAYATADEIHRKLSELGA